MVIGIPNVGKSSLINSLRHLHLKRSTCSVTLQEIAFKFRLNHVCCVCDRKSSKGGTGSGSDQKPADANQGQFWVAQPWKQNNYLLLKGTFDLRIGQVSERPPIMILDTPGILCPRVSDPNSAMKLALCCKFHKNYVYISNKVRLLSSRWHYFSQFERPSCRRDGDGWLPFVLVQLQSSFWVSLFQQLLRIRIIT